MAMATAPSTAQGHAFGQRYDLPLPFWLYIAGAGAAVFLSFVVMVLCLGKHSAAKTYPRIDLLRVPIVRLLAQPPVMFCFQLTSVLLFLLILTTGFFGSESPFKNPAPILVWVIWWVGGAYLTAMIGNFWALMNPWKIVFGWVERLYCGLTEKSTFSPNLPYPSDLGVWPGVILFLLFVWMELVWSGSDHPRSLVIAILAYTVLTWLGMYLFGRDDWLAHGEAFSIVFGLLARFAPTEIRVNDPRVCERCPESMHEGTGCVNCYSGFGRAAIENRQWNLRPYAVGLLTSKTTHTSLMVLTIVMLSTVTFDGFAETLLWSRIVALLLTEPLTQSLLASFQASGADLESVIKSTGLLTFPILFVLIYLVFSWLMSIAASRQSTTLETARLFVFTLIPIALAYHLAHYLSYLLIAGQLVIPLASDPFGIGWNLFGTVNYRLRLEVVNARMVWYTAVTVIVVGHIIAVFLAHVTALRHYQDTLMALRSQIPMLALMVGYTMISLWILAQPIVEL